MFNRRLAVTLVKKNKDDDPSMDTSAFDQIGETIVTTAAGVGFVVVLTAGALTGMRIVEHATKYILR